MELLAKETIRDIRGTTNAMVLEDAKPLSGHRESRLAGFCLYSNSGGSSSLWHQFFPVAHAPEWGHSLLVSWN